MARKAPAKGRGKSTTTGAPAKTSPKRPARPAVPKSRASSPSSKPAKRLTPLKDLSPAYAKRLRRQAERAGVTVRELRKSPKLAGAARGHAAPLGMSESQVRRLRAEARIQAAAEAQARRWKDGDAEAMAGLLRQKVREHGMGWLARWQKRIGELEALRARQPKDAKGRPESIGINLDTLAIEFGLQDIPELMGYH